MSSIPRDEQLFQYATDRQRQLLEAYWRLGSQQAVAAELGVARQTVSIALQMVLRKAAKRGYSPPHDLTHVVPDGYKLKGASTLYDGEGKVAAQWVKTTEDAARQEEMFRAMIEGFTAEVPRLEPTPFSGATLNDLLTVYPVGDHHFGMYAWNEEAGADYDLTIAEKLLVNSFFTLASSVPRTTRALVALLGDLQHYDGLEPVTPTAKNQLDSDGRFPLMVRTVIRGVRRILSAALEQHAEVDVIVQAGNHDPSSAIFLAEALAALYENEPRIRIDTSPRAFHYHEFGRNLVGVCHGHEVKKLDALPLIMASDRPEAWGRTKHRYWLTGHVHHDRVVDVGGVRVESFRVLPPTDAWADGKGYRSAREMKALVLHAAHGEVQRVSVNPGMFLGDAS